MKIYVYNKLPFETQVLNLLANSTQDTITVSEDCLTLETLDRAKGFDGVSIVSYSKITSAELDKMKELGILYLSTRTIGFDHIDVQYAQKIGIHVFNAYYQPYNVADFAVMQMMNLMRKTKISICRALVNDFSLDGMQGREMRSMTIGVIGTGKIGSTVIQNLSGFGCKTLAYDLYQNAEVAQKASYVDLETLYKESDIITLHCPLTDKNYHMINAESIGKRKDGVLIINTARGQLIDTNALITALETGKVGGAALDTIEEEDGIMHVHVGTRILDEHKRNVLYIKQFPNVIYTQHYGFFTQEATESMTRSGVTSIQKAFAGEKLKNEITHYELI